MQPRAVLLNPPFPYTVFRDHYCSSEAKSTYLWHPLDLLLQSAHLKAAGYAVSAWDCMANPMETEQLTAWIYSLKAQLAVVLVSERTWEKDRETLEILRTAGVKSIAASGDFLRFGTGPIEEARGLVDFVLTDFTTPHLATSVAQGQVSGMGIATVEQVSQGDYRPMGNEALQYPVPDQRLFGAHPYRLPYPGFVDTASVLTTYGCPHHCKYCHVGELGARLRSPENIVQELMHLAQEGFSHVYIRDATLNANRAHLQRWLTLLIEADLDLQWATFATAKPMDDELAGLMAKAGCKHLQIGLETAVDALRDHNGKPYRGEAHQNFIEICHRHDIQVTAHLVFGLPGEDENSLKFTAEALSNSKLDYVAVNLAEDRPGLPWRKEGVHLPISLQHPKKPAHLLHWQNQAYRHFYMRPQRMTKELVERLKYKDFSDLFSLGKSAVGWMK